MDFDFDAWQARRERRRCERREELRAALAAGRRLRETISADVVLTWPDCSPFLPEFNTPESLSTHLEAREHGLGFALEILPMTSPEPAARPAYSHVGHRSYVGHYAVTADAHRTPGRTHALNPVEGERGVYRALCGTFVSEGSDDHFLDEERNVGPAAPGHRITCKRCRKRLA